MKITLRMNKNKRICEGKTYLNSLRENKETMGIITEQESKYICIETSIGHKPIARSIKKGMIRVKKERE